MVKITDIFKKKEKTFSFEVFPVSTPEATEKLYRALESLSGLEPDFISCTYGAGGGNRERTLDVVDHIQKKHRIPAMAHLTCVLHTRREIEMILEEFKKRNIVNILALRGDPPKDGGLPINEFRYSSDLVSFVRQHLQHSVSIGVAGFPEKHILAPDIHTDAQFLKTKINAGADFVITQLFFDNRLYFDYLARLRAIGVYNRVIPGILPITDYEALKRFCQRCGAGIPKEVDQIFSPLVGDAAGTLQAGIDFAIRQCRELLDGGAPGIHFYALNKLHPVDHILKKVRGY